MEQPKAWWQNLSNEQKLVLFIVVVISAVGILFATLWQNQKSSKVVLYSHLSSEDLTTSSVELFRVGIPNEVVESSGTLLVPSDYIDQARMALAQAGLPRSGIFWIPGFELLDKTSLTTSEFMQKANYQRALQGEIARSIMTLEPVASARLHLNIPQPTVFEEKKKPTTASVVVALKPNKSLSESQTKAIVFLVSQAIEGLRPENVVVVDTQGELLWAGVNGGEDGSANGVSRYFQMRLEVERALEKKLQHFLNRTLGPAKSSVHVSVELDTDKRYIESETYTPSAGGQSLPTVTAEFSESSQSQGTPLGGPVGATSNLGLTTPTAPVTLGGTNYNRKEQRAEYRVSKRIERIEHTPGSVKRMFISVLVRDNLSTAEQTRLQQAVTAAAGIDTGRGDSVVVIPVRTDWAPETLPSKPEKERGRVFKPTGRPWLWLAAIPALLLLAIPLLVVWRRRAPVAPPAPSPQIPAAQPAEAPSVKRRVRQVTPVDEFRSFAREEPERVAEVIRSWIMEEEAEESTDV